MTDIIVSALLSLLTPMHFLFLLLGTLLGLIVGILPGLGGIVGLSLMLPFVYGMDPLLALPMMIGLLAVTNTSDTFPAILMGIPGTSGAQATVLDGHPLSKQGDAARALGAAFSASMLGGVFGALLLSLAILIARPIILAVGYGEQLMLIILALTMVGMLTGTSALKGIAACGIGLLLGSIGAAPSTGEYRLSFDTLYLSDGIPLVVVGLAMFAIPEIVDILSRNSAISATTKLGSGTLKGFRETLHHKWLVIRCSTIGVLIGAMPGLGGSVVTWIAYGHAMQSAKNREKFGAGDIRGIIAPEAANNADNGGALMPTLMFGIPGSGSMAVFLGGLILLGIDPGIGMMERHLDLTYVMVWSLALANVIGTAICLFLARPIAKLTLVSFNLLAPFIIVIIFFGAYQATQSWYDIIALLSLGVLATYMKRFGWSRPALLIGFVLSMRLDGAVYQSVQVYGLSMLERPGVQIMMALIALSIFIASRMKPQRQPLTQDGLHGPVNKGPQLMFLAVLICTVIFVVWHLSHFTFLARVFPLTSAILTLISLVAVLILSLRKRPSYVLYDSDKDNDGSPTERVGLWGHVPLFAMLGCIALGGFILGVFAFIAIFLRTQAALSWAKALSAALGALIVLALLAHFLMLDFPRGLLQELVELPWILK